MKRYQVSPYFKFTVISAATSIFLLVLYFTELLQYYFPKQIKEFNISNLKNKQYVSVTSHECIPAPGSQGNASNSVFLSLTNEYHTYRLRVGEQGSIEVGIYDKNMIQTLESWPEGKGNSSITVIARVTIDSGRAILLQVTPSEMKTHYGVLSFVAGILLIVYLPISLLRSSFMKVKMIDFFKEPVSYLLNDEGITVSAQGEEQTIPWSDCVKACNTRQSYFVYTGKNSAFIFPKKDMGDKTGDVLMMINTHMDPAKVKIKFGGL